MKILLSLVICIHVEGVCMPAYEWPEKKKKKKNLIRCMIV